MKALRYVLNNIILWEGLKLKFLPAHMAFEMKVKGGR